MKRPSLLLSGLAALGFALATHTLARRTRPDHRYASVFTRRLQDRPTDTDSSPDPTTFDQITSDTHESAPAAGLPAEPMASDGRANP